MLGVSSPFPFVGEKKGCWWETTALSMRSKCGNIVTRHSRRYVLLALAVDRRARAGGREGRRRRAGRRRRVAKKTAYVKCGERGGEREESSSIVE